MYFYAGASKTNYLLSVIAVIQPVLGWKESAHTDIFHILPLELDPARSEATGSNLSGWFLPVISNDAACAIAW